MKSLLMLAAVFYAGCLPAFAGPASDAVRYFYTPEVRYAADGDYRNRFTEPVTRLFDLNDAAIEKNPDQIACIDFDPGIDAQDFDQAIVDRTLKLAERVDGDSAEVTATFQLFAGDEDASREMLWSLKKTDGAWKIADIASKTHNWKLSELDCVMEEGGE